MFGVLATTPFILLMIVGGLLKWENTCSVGSVGCDVMWCFIIIHTAAVKAWRVTRPGWRYEIEVFTFCSEYPDMPESLCIFHVFLMH
jgi:hypothetical protein